MENQQVREAVMTAKMTRRIGPKRNRPMEGKCNIGKLSGLRKLARAIRRGFVQAQYPPQKAGTTAV